MYVLPLLCCAHNTMCFCVARIWESRDHGTLFLLRARARRRRLFFCVARIWESRDHGTLYFLLCAYGSPAIMAPYIFFAFLRCAHMGVPRSWHPIYFLPFCVARIWESRDHGTLYFCSAHAAEVDVKETRSGHVPYGVVLRSSINAFCTIRGGFPKSQILEI